jgi:oligosaccharide repeat unit polymerase
MGLDFLIIGLTALTLANYWFKRSVLYPPFLFCGMWLLDAILHSVQIVEVDPLHPVTLEVVFAGAVLFSLGGLFAYFIPSRLVNTRLTVFGRPKRAAAWMQYLMLGVLSASIVVGIRSAVTLAGGISGANGLFFAAARQAMVENANAGLDSFQVSNYIGTWAIFVAALFLSDRMDRLAWTATGIAFTACIMSGGRTGLLSLFASVTCIILIKTNRERFVLAARFARWPIIAFVLLFGGMVFLNKNISAGSGSIVGLGGQFVVQYIVGGLAALDKVLTHMGDYRGDSNHTFEFFLRIASTLKIISYSPPPTLDEWINVPFPTNVYTYYRYIVTDFGISIAIALTGLIGFLHSLLYRKAHAGSIIGLYLFSLTMYSVLMVTFSDAYWRFGNYFSAFAIAAFYSIVKSVPSKLFRPRQEMSSLSPQ